LKELYALNTTAFSAMAPRIGLDMPWYSDSTPYLRIVFTAVSTGPLNAFTASVCWRTFTVLPGEVSPVSRARRAGRHALERVLEDLAHEAGDGALFVITRASVPRGAPKARSGAPRRNSASSPSPPSP